MGRKKKVGIWKRNKNIDDGRVNGKEEERKDIWKTKKNTGDGRENIKPNEEDT